jgi:hypothetical protein
MLIGQLTELPGADTLAPHEGELVLTAARTCATVLDARAGQGA